MKNRQNNFFTDEEYRTGENENRENENRESRNDGYRKEDTEYLSDEELMKLIQNSVDDVEIPESLQPETIQKKLEMQCKKEEKPIETAEEKQLDQMSESEKVSKKKVIPFWKYGSWAAVILLVAAAVQVLPVLKRDTGLITDQSMEIERAEDVTMPETAQEYILTEENVTEEIAESSIKDTTDVVTKATMEEVGIENTTISENTAVAHVESYEALYDMISSYRQRSRDMLLFDSGVVYETESVMDAAGDYMVEESAVDGAGSYAVEESAVDASGDYMTEESVMDMEVSSAAVESGTSDYSTTNTQEESVDEADIVKTDGKYIYALDDDGTVRIVAVNSGAVHAENDKAAETPENTVAETSERSKLEIISKIQVADGVDDRCLDMYVDGDLLQVVKKEENYITYEEELALPNSDGVFTRSYYSVPAETTVVVTYDISDRTSPKKSGSYSQDGHYLSSRKNGDYLYLFTSFMPEAGNSAQTKESYVPKAGDSFVAYDEIYLPSAGEWAYDGKRYLVAGSVKNTEPDKAQDCMAIMSGADTFYVSENNIYSATSSWADDANRTELVRIGYKDGIFTPGSAGKVIGGLNDNFSLNEHAGNLRLVATVDAWKNNVYSRTNSLYVLDQNLQVIGKIDDLAENEEIKSARFMGDTGYFVTYENTDPLFSVDLSDPYNPKVLGELKITGFSEYLHFYGKNKLLGIGWETDPKTGATEGMKCSMFDLSDPTDVQETDRLILKDVRYCTGLENYKAILADPEKNIFGFAYQIPDENWENGYYYGVFSYTEKGLVPNTYINLSNTELFEHGSSYLEFESLRGIYIGDLFYLVGDSGILCCDMTDDFALVDEIYW